jgi:hypothetical protein
LRVSVCKFGVTDAARMGVHTRPAPLQAHADDNVFLSASYSPITDLDHAGTLDTNTAHTVVGNLAAITTGLGHSVNSAMYWDGGHAVNFDSPDLIEWIGRLTGYFVA